MSLVWRLRRWFPGLPIPLRLSCGAWWISRNDIIGRPVFDGNFENVERDFVKNYLLPGMTVLDIGAHHGLYTVIAACQVGLKGHVYAFEPSPREQKILRQNIRLNRFKNVTVEGLALGSSEAQGSLYLVEGAETACNSLRPPRVEGGTSAIPVHVTRLDDWIDAHKIERVDFVKLDVEGGEMEVLKGADRFLDRVPRPLMLVEVQDMRTQPWGYPAKDIVEHLRRRGYKWLSFLADGALAELDLSKDTFCENFVACPPEREHTIPKRAA